MAAKKPGTVWRPIPVLRGDAPRCPQCPKCRGFIHARNRMDVGTQKDLDRHLEDCPGVCAKCAVRPDDYGLCSPCSKAVYFATEVGKLYARFHADPSLQTVTTYAAVSPEGVLTTIVWHFLRSTDCNGDPSGWWSPSIRIGNHLRSLGMMADDPFYSSQQLIQDLEAGR